MPIKFPPFFCVLLLSAQYLGRSKWFLPSHVREDGPEQLQPLNETGVSDSDDLFWFPL